MQPTTDLADIDFERVRDAVQFLVDTPYYHHYVRRVRSTAQRPRALPYRDKEEPLNELLRLGRINLQAMENLLAVAQYKRDDNSRAAYQRKFMAAKRQRDRKVIELEQLLLGRKLSKDEQRQALLKQYDIWNRERDRMLSSLGTVPWEEENQHRADFWAAKEREIEALIEEAKAQPVVHRKPPKRVVVVPAPAPKTAFGQKLASVVGRKS